MIHVCTTGKNSGLVQLFLPKNTGPHKTRSAVWVFVVRGRVGIGTGNGDTTHDNDAVSAQWGTWDELTAPNGVSPANELVVYATSPEGACCYIDDAAVIG
jgi:hypothetical protein